MGLPCLGPQSVVLAFRLSHTRLCISLAVSPGTEPRVPGRQGVVLFGALTPLLLAPGLGAFQI